MKGEQQALVSVVPAASEGATRVLPTRDLPAIIALLALAIVLGHSTVHRAAWSRTHRSDFTVYTAAGDAFLRGQDIYAAQNPRGWMYMYLPVFAVAVAPLARLPVAWAAGIWYVLSVGMLVHTLWLSSELARRFWPSTRLTRFQIGLLALLGVLWPAMSGLARGQASVLVAYLVTLAIWATVQRRPPRPWLAGGTLAGAIVLKVFPLLFLPYLVLRRRWSVVLTSGVWLLLLVFVLPGFAFGFRANVELVHRWTTTIALSANQPDEAETQARYGQMIDPRIERNQSLKAVMIRLMAADDRLADATGRENLAEGIAKAMGVALVLVTAWVCFVPQRRRAASAGVGPAGGPVQAEDDEDREARRTIVHCCLAILLMLFLSPVSWVHSYALLALPLGVVVAAATSPSGVAWPRGWALAYGAFLVSSALGLAVWDLRTGGALLWGTVVLWGAFAASPDARPIRRPSDALAPHGEQAVLT